ncbi:MAG: FAD binding domain-containing protein [Nitrososphaerales archaeon]
MLEFDYLSPNSVSEAIALKEKYGQDSTYVAGGTNLLYLMKRGVRTPKYLINIKDIGGMDSISYDNKTGLSIGSLAKIDDLQYSESVNAHYPMLSQCAARIASPQIRNSATVGGNLSQEVWCWYLTEGFNCWMNGGKHCYAPAGDNRYHHTLTGGYICMAIHPSDLATAFAALDARVQVVGSSKKKELGIEELLPGFTKVDGKLKQNILKSDELVTGIRVPPPALGSRGLFLKYAARESFDFALSAVALSMTFVEDVCKDLKIFLGGVSAGPYRSEKAESILNGKKITKELLEEASQNVFSKQMPLSLNAYRIRLTKELLREALLELCSPVLG